MGRPVPPDARAVDVVNVGNACLREQTGNRKMYTLKTGELAFAGEWASLPDPVLVPAKPAMDFKHRLR